MVLLPIAAPVEPGFPPSAEKAHPANLLYLVIAALLFVLSMNRFALIGERLWRFLTWSGAIVVGTWSISRAGYLRAGAYWPLVALVLIVILALLFLLEKERERPHVAPQPLWPAYYEGGRGGEGGKGGGGGGGGGAGGGRGGAGGKGGDSIVYSESRHRPGSIQSGKARSVNELIERGDYLRSCLHERSDTLRAAYIGNMAEEWVQECWKRLGEDVSELRGLFHMQTHAGLTAPEIMAYLDARLSELRRILERLN